jgi:hypothetical protein
LAALPAFEDSAPSSPHSTLLPSTDGYSPLARRWVENTFNIINDIRLIDDQPPSDRACCIAVSPTTISSKCRLIANWYVGELAEAVRREDPKIPLEQPAWKSSGTVITTTPAYRPR